MGTMINRRRVYVEKGLLPNGYTQLEYIESTGTQYINTGINLPSNFAIKTIWSISEYLQYGFLCGARNEPHNNCFNMLMSRNSFGIDISENSLYRNVFSPVNLNQFYNIECIIEAGRTIVKVDNVTKLNISVTPSISGYPLWIFDSNTAGEETGFKGKYKLKSFSIDGILNLIPCRRNSDNIVGMYDTVSQTFFTNAGTGTFIAGPEV